MRKNYKSEKERPDTRTDPELVTSISREYKCSHAEASAMVSKFIEGIRKSIVTNGFCNLRNLGRFELRTRKHVKFRHFQGHYIEIPVLFALRFRSSTSMRVLINEKSIMERRKALEKTKIPVS